MSDYDVIVRGATAVTPEGPADLDVGISDGRIAALEPELVAASQRALRVRAR